MQPGAFRLAEASQYLGLDEGSRWLTEKDCPVKRCDMRKPGAAKPLWVWRRVDLDAFLESRVVPPGHASPFGPEGQ